MSPKRKRADPPRQVRTATSTKLQSAAVPLWREVLFGFDWLALRMSPVYYGFGVPRGDGAPVIVIPGFLGSDDYLIELYNWLRRIGYRSYYSRIGRNADCPDLLTERLFTTMDRASQETGRQLHLIGHSLGGLIARSAATRRPEQVAQVITLAAPFRDIRAHPAILAAAGLIRWRVLDQRYRQRQVKRTCYTGNCTCDFANSLRSDLPEGVAHAAIVTKSDGVVDWRVCVDEDKRHNTEVRGTHIGLAFNPQVYRRLAELLAHANPARAAPPALGRSSSL